MTWCFWPLTMHLLWLGSFLWGSVGGAASAVIGEHLVVDYRTIWTLLVITVWCPALHWCTLSLLKKAAPAFSLSEFDLWSRGFSFGARSVWTRNALSESESLQFFSVRDPTFRGPTGAHVILWHNRHRTTFQPFVVGKAEHRPRVELWHLNTMITHNPTVRLWWDLFPAIFLFVLLLNMYLPSS